jgi:hypothetical protein
MPQCCMPGGRRNNNSPATRTYFICSLRVRYATGFGLWASVRIINAEFTPCSATASASRPCSRSRVSMRLRRCRSLPILNSDSLRVRTQIWRGCIQGLRAARRLPVSPQGVDLDATQFTTVEIDSTHYGTPGESTVTNWYERTPPDFVFAAKVPQIVTHEKVLKGCEAIRGLQK